MKKPRRLEDLVAYQLSIALRDLIHRYCRKDAIKSDFKFHSNFADAASSAPRNIAEGWGRKYHKEFARFAIIARGSEQEVLTCLTEALARGYIDHAEWNAGDHAARKALKVLNRFIDYLESTPNWGRESPASPAICSPNGEGEEARSTKEKGGSRIDRADRRRNTRR